MRFARLTCPQEHVDQTLCDWALGAELDLLQLDYPRPHAMPATGSRAPDFADYPGAAPRQLGTLGRLFYLTPETRVITSAGWAHAYGCAEAIGQQLVEAGARDVLVSAIRGSNLLPILEDLQVSGTDLSHAETGAPLAELRAPLFAADLQVGAGPIATAMLEDARVIVAGCFDPCSPAMAGAVATYDWPWDDGNRLAAAACLARAVLAPLSRGELEAAFARRVWRPRRGTVDAAGEATIALASAAAGDDDDFASWLRRQWDHDPSTADVVCDAQRLETRLTAGGELQLGGVRGRPAPPHWRLDLYYFSGFAVDVMVIQRDSSADDGLLKSVEQYVKSLDDSQRTVASELLAQPGGHSLLRIHVRSEQYASARQAADEIDNVVACCSSQLEGLGPATVAAHYGIWPTNVPRDAVDIAVDTRPAGEWV